MDAFHGILYRQFIDMNIMFCCVDYYFLTVRFWNYFELHFVDFFTIFHVDDPFYPLTFDTYSLMPLFCYRFYSIIFTYFLFMFSTFFSSLDFVFVKFLNNFYFAHLSMPIRTKCISLLIKFSMIAVVVNIPVVDWEAVTELELRLFDFVCLNSNERLFFVIFNCLNYL